ncbi:hypothetical protein QFC22_004390 [Naganishia vaughanmartiniae]|uniref:Uncharacterized protein n=1 Tax=Naganishia vaughanmartiniae TaxID=1424756 RepID=A0ACC2X2C8_9TREE|nr:hypothetical protein QFC22_004390 [Naganishia vaughanmartiniae]
MVMKVDESADTYCATDSVESLTPHPGDESDHEHEYNHVGSHPGSPHIGSPSHVHAHHHDPRTASSEPDSRDSTSSTAIFDAEQEEQEGALGKGRFALKKTGKDRMAASWDEEQGMGNVWMPSRVESDGDGETRAGGQPFAGAARGYVKSVPTTIGTTNGGGGGDGEEATGIPPHLRMNSRTALFPAPRPTLATTQSRRHRDSNISSRSMTDRCQEALGGASGHGVAGLNATLGLVIHALADGVALGASSLSGSGGLGLVVFLAVIVHKGPTALGLTTTLLSLGLTKKQIRTRLFLFSIAAPLGAMVTYMVVKAVGAGQGGHRDDEVDAIGWWTGVVLLFSGGSFLYVATVISPLSDSDAHGTHQHAHEGHHEQPEERLGQKARLGLLLVGMVFPLLLSTTVGHAH